MRSNQARAREMKLSLLECRQKRRELASRPRDRDSFVRDGFSEMQHVDAIVEHRGARLLEVEPPRIDLPQMDDELGLEMVIALDQVLQMQQELTVGKTVKETLQSRHGTSPHRDRGVTRVSVALEIRELEIRLCFENGGNCISVDQVAE